MGYVKKYCMILNRVMFCCYGVRMLKIKGFTLIELIVTILILAIIATLAVPAFNDMQLQQNLNKSQQELIAVLNEARSKAVLQRQEVTVTLNSNIANTETQLNWMPSGSAVLDSSSPLSIVFRMNGLVNATTDTTFVICTQAGGNKSKSVSISKMGTIQNSVDGTC